MKTSNLITQITIKILIFSKSPRFYLFVLFFVLLSALHYGNTKSSLTSLGVTQFPPDDKAIKNTKEITLGLQLLASNEGRGTPQLVSSNSDFNR
jgi:hypothetical protein